MGILNRVYKQQRERLNIGDYFTYGVGEIKYELIKIFKASDEINNHFMKFTNGSRYLIAGVRDSDFESIFIKDNEIKRGEKIKIWLYGADPKGKEVLFFLEKDFIRKVFK